MYQRCVTVSVFVALALGIVVGDISNKPGTTPDLQNVFIGRCWDYRMSKYQDILPRVKANCTFLWESFSRAFTYKAPCGLPISNFDEFIEESRQELPKDKSMFWDETYALVHQYSYMGQKFVAMEDTLHGYLLDRLTWCGQLAPPGINYTTCPAMGDCELDSMTSYWSAASKAYASQATGEVTVMLNGSNSLLATYRRDSFFSKFELMSLNPTKVTKVNALVVHNLNMPVREHCNKGSLLDLRKDVTDRGFQYSCQDNPIAVRFLQCSNDPSGPGCEMPGAAAISTGPSTGIVCATVMGVLFQTLLIHS